MLSRKDWEKSQQEEFFYWEKENTVEKTLKEYLKTYTFFTKFLKLVDKKKSFVLDLGCGSVTYSTIFNFKHLYLCDSQLNKYLLLPSYRTNLNNYSSIKVQSMAENLPFENNVFDVVLFLRTIDHVLYPRKAFEEAVRVTKFNKYILFYVVFRKEKEICHPHIFNQERINQLIVDNDLILEDLDVVYDTFEDLNGCGYILKKK